MFSLIISIIAIALVAALAAATVFYGAKSYQEHSARANVARVLNEAEQISGAFTAYKVEKGAINIQQPCDDDGDPDTTTDYDGCLKTLVDENYLTSIMKGDDGFAWRVDTEKNTLVKSGLTLQECSLANFMAGAETQKDATPPTCGDESSAHVCCKA